MATIRKRGSAWRAEICVRGVRQSATFDTKREAEAWARSTEASVDAGTYVDHRSASEITLQELIERYIEEKVKGRRRTPHSEQKETYLLKRLAKVNFSALPLATLTPVHFNSYRTARERVVAPATVRNELVAFSSVIQTAMTEWGFGLRENPASGIKVKRPRVDNERDRILEGDEAEHLWLALSKARNPLAKPAAMFAYETGLRLSELLAITWLDINLHERTVRVNKVHDASIKNNIDKTKNGGQRFVPLSSRAIEILNDLERVETRVFPVSHDSIRSAFKFALKRAGIDGFHWHDFRHCAITMMARYIHNPFDMMSVSGHKTVSQVTRYYTATKAKQLATALP